MHDPVRAVPLLNTFVRPAVVRVRAKMRRTHPCPPAAPIPSSHLCGCGARDAAIYPAQLPICTSHSLWLACVSVYVP